MANFCFNSKFACADPEIFMRGGPTKMVIFGYRRGGVQLPKNPEITFFMPPTLKKLEGHIAFGLSVCLSVCLCVCASINF